MTDPINSQPPGQPIKSQPPAPPIAGSQTPSQEPPLPPGLQMWRKMFPTATNDEVKHMNDQMLKSIGDQIQKDQAKFHKVQEAIKKMWETGEYDPPDGTN